MLTVAFFVVTASRITTVLLIISLLFNLALAVYGCRKWRNKKHRLAEEVMH